MDDWMFSPLTWGLLLAAVLCMTWRLLRRWLRITGLAVIGLLLLLCTPLGANTLVRYVEARTPVQAYCRPGTMTDARPLVLLSGGLDRSPDSANDYAALTLESWRRLRGAVDSWRRTPGSDLVIAGGGSFAVKESVVLASLARDWGVPGDRLHLETASTTTWESAMALRGTLPSRIRLVSSALHLPRALLAFRAAGIQACADPAGSDYQPPGGGGYFIPQISAIEKTQGAVYELVGTLDYSVRASRLAREQKVHGNPRIQR